MPDHATITSDADLELYDDIVDAINRVNIVSESRSPINVSVDEGIVTVSGNVLTRTIGDAALYAAARVPGVKKVINDLHNDMDIEEKVAAALSRSSEIRPFISNFVITSYLGALRLTGQVDTPDQRATAVELASSVAGVRQVVDQISIAPAEGDNSEEKA